MSFINQLNILFNQLRNIEDNFAQNSLNLLENSNILASFNEELFYEELLNFELPAQYYNENQFGEYNITLFNDIGISIQLYFMDSYLTNIHSHPFEGAFTVLKGQSVQSHYKFESTRKQSEKLEIGKLTLTGSTKLSKGQCSLISLDSIHQLLRLKKKNITLLVSKLRPIDNSQFFYPALKLSSTSVGHDTSRKLSLLNYYLKNEDTNIKTKTKKLFDKLPVEDLIEIFGHIGQIQSGPYRQLIQTQLLEKIKTTDLEIYNYLIEHQKYQLGIKKKFDTLKET